MYTIASWKLNPQKDENGKGKNSEEQVLSSSRRTAVG
jgi:hypothetical protein